MTTLRSHHGLPLTLYVIASCVVGVGCGRTSLLLDEPAGKAFDDATAPDALGDERDMSDGEISLNTDSATMLSWDSAADAGADAGDCLLGIACDGRCTDPNADPSNCGRCGQTCAGGMVCLLGTCQAQCPRTLAECAGGCVYLESNPTNCGACGVACACGRVCAQGGCACTLGQQPSDCGGACVDLASDAANCGACGHVCNPPVTPGGGPGSGGGAPSNCAAGKCVVQCLNDLSECNRGCVNLQSDPRNCGVCGRQCGDVSVCVGGSCTCDGANDAYCHGSCVDVTSSSADCGGCDLNCPAGVLCHNGACDISCSSGLALCAGNCVDLMTSPAHCGFCDQNCGGDLVCAAGQCACPAGLTDCDGDCVDLRSDDRHCGQCGIQCGVSQTCIAAGCQ